MDPVMFRRGMSVYIRPIERADIPLMLRGINNPDVTEHLARVFPAYEAEEEDLVAGLHKNTTGYMFAIVLLEDHRVIGVIGLHGIKWPNRTATTGTAIWSTDDQGRGYGTEAKMLLLDFAFNALDLLMIQSLVRASNGRSLRYADKCGYKEVGRIPQWLRCQDGDGRDDEVILIVSQERWRPLWLDYKAKRDANKM